MKRTPEFLDQRSLELHKIIVDEIRKNPDLFEVVKENISRWKPMVTKNTLPYLEEWESFINQGMEVCLEAALDESEYGKARRQASPFAGVLPDKERHRFFQEYTGN